MSELKLCPFCGAKPEYKSESQNVPPYGMRTWIKCPQCRQSQICSDWYDGDLGTMEASWNTRHTQRYLTSVEKGHIADNIVIEGRSKTDVVQDVWDEIKERLMI